ncbi:MAG: WD40 repeat domain-containing protein, partial [Caldilinea sp.]
MLDDPTLLVVLVRRYEYVAALDPYATLGFNRLRARFYMERMEKEAALEAVRQPARLHGQPFASGVAEKLVEDLLQVSVPGQETTVLGQYVEPVQLQVVCYQVWEKLAKDASERQTANQALLITAENLTAAGDVEQALKEFYAETLALVLADLAATGVSERRVRSWFDASLITAVGTRGLVQEGETETAGLPNGVVRALQKRFLVRGEVRGGNTWIELVHDRFVEPIRADNAAWFAQHLSTLQRQAALWNEQGRSDGLLLRGEVLAEAAAWAEAQTEPLEKTEQEFLNACKSAEAAAEREQQQNRRIRLLAVAAFVIAVVAMIAAGLAWQQTQEAKRQKERADTNAEEANKAALLVLAENLAGQSQLLLRADKQFGDLALILARDAALLGESPNISAALRTAADNARLRLVIPSPQRRHQGGVSSVDFSPNGQTIVSGGEDGTVRIWNAADLQPQQLFFNHIGAVTALNFSPDGQRIVSGGEDGTLRIWEVAGGQQGA